MSHRRRVWITPVRLRKPIARGAVSNCRGRKRRPGLHATRRTWDRSGGENPRLQITGRRIRYGGSERETRRAAVSIPHEQSEKSSGVGRLRPGDGRTGPDSNRGESAQRKISRDKKSKARPSAVI